MTPNKWLFSFVLTLAWLTALASPAQAASPSRIHSEQPVTASADPNDPQDQQAFWDAVIPDQLQKNHIAGAVVTVVSGGQVVFSKGYGYADVEAKTPIDPAVTLFRPGSISKLFVGVAAMQLAEQGRLDFSADINQYLKDLQIPAAYSKPITMANLLTHTAGFDTTYSGTYANSVADLAPLGSYLASHIPRRVYPPGQVAAYSNYGISLAGHVIEQITGVPFDQYVATNILAPLGMLHSTFTQPLPDSLAGSMSKGYVYSNNQFVPKPYELVKVWPAGSLAATAADMDRFMIAMLGDGSYAGGRVLQPASLRELEKVHFQAAPQASGMAYTFEEMHLNGLRLLTKGGDTTFFHSQLVLIPEKNVGFFISYNTFSAVLIKEEALQPFLDRYFTSPVSTVIPVTGAAQDVAQYLGAYAATQRAESNYWKVVQLPNSWVISPAPAGGIMAPDAFNHVHRFVEVEPGVFHQVDGQEVVVFRQSEAGGGMTMIVGNQPIIEYTRLPWYLAPLPQALLLVACLLIFLSALIIWPVAALVRALRRQAAPPPLRAVRWMAALAGAFAIAFVVGYFSLIFQAIFTGFGIPQETMIVVLTLGVISAIFGVATVVSTLWIWRRGFPMGLASRLHYTLLAVACLAFVWFLNIWNLLGYHL